MNWGFHDNRFPELCSGKSFIFAKAYFSDCIVSSVLIEACRRTQNLIGIVDDDRQLYQSGGGSGTHHYAL